MTPASITGLGACATAVALNAQNNAQTDGADITRIALS